ncbi:hypothetical protein [Thiothrix lacustris]|uniref:hypothetical protein n=1 Tax=Thiothrix lacustris TaxID=525917 RepID=UPI0027E52FA2|nr:hypothetical protein [Thiothrix lacustris]WMP17644.1 hypothetical protein RCS87_00930 [Thiothrix lacustris]
MLINHKTYTLIKLILILLTSFLLASCTEKITNSIPSTLHGIYVLSKEPSDPNNAITIIELKNEYVMAGVMDKGVFSKRKILTRNLTIKNEQKGKSGVLYLSTNNEIPATEFHVSYSNSNIIKVQLLISTGQGNTIMDLGSFIKEI